MNNVNPQKWLADVLVKIYDLSPHSITLLSHITGKITHKRFLNIFRSTSVDVYVAPPQKQIQKSNFAEWKI